MNTTAPAIQAGSAPSFDHELVATDAMVEFGDLFRLMQATTFTSDLLKEEGMTLLRGMVCRLHSLAEVMYAAATRVSAPSRPNAEPPPGTPIGSSLCFVPAGSFRFG